MCESLLWNSRMQIDTPESDTLHILSFTCAADADLVSGSLTAKSIPYCVINHGEAVTLLIYAECFATLSFCDPVRAATMSIHPLCELAAFLDECLQLSTETIKSNKRFDATIENEEQLRQWFIFSFIMGSTDSGFNNLLTDIRKKEPYSLCRYLIQHRCSSEKVQGLCKTYGLSYSYFRKVAKKYFGVSAKTKLSEWRLAQTILDILDGNDSITEIALRNGFSSSAHVCSTFKSTLGLTPYEIRKINEKG